MVCRAAAESHTPGNVTQMLFPRHYGHSKTHWGILTPIICMTVILGSVTHPDNTLAAHLHTQVSMNVNLKVQVAISLQDIPGLSRIMLPRTPLPEEHTPAVTKSNGPSLKTSLVCECYLEHPCLKNLEEHTPAVMKSNGPSLRHP